VQAKFFPFKNILFVTLIPEMSQEKYGMSDGMKRKGNSRLIIRKVFKPVATVPPAPKKREAKPEALVYNTKS